MHVGGPRWFGGNTVFQESEVPCLSLSLHSMPHSGTQFSAAELHHTSLVHRDSASTTAETFMNNNTQNFAGQEQIDTRHLSMPGIKV